MSWEQSAENANRKLIEIKSAAKKNSVPIMQDETARFICGYIKNHGVESVLEIGSAVGYSAISFALVSEKIKVTTIEIDIDRVIRAKENFKKAGVEKKIEIIHADALECTLNGKFDLIFIDAAKCQYRKFFEKFSGNLSERGAIVSDNLLFHGMVRDESLTRSYSTRKMVRKIRRYTEFLRESTEFHTDFFEIGDGISVTTRKKNFADFAAENLKISGGKNFDVFKIDDEKNLKLFAPDVPEETALSEFRNSLFLENQKIPAEKIFEIVRVKNRFGEIQKNENAEPLEEIFKKSGDAQKEKILEELAELQKKIIKIPAEKIQCYKENLIFKTGGNTEENSATVRKIKKLPEGGFFCHGNFSLKNAFIKNDGTIFVSSSGEFFRAPKEFFTAKIFVELQEEFPRENFGEKYVSILGENPDEIKPFAEILSLLK
jgi:predicted O-methyltransferase YrrM